MRSSRAFRRARYGSGSKIAPHEINALRYVFVLVLEIFKNHVIREPARRRISIYLSESQQYQNS